MHKKVKSKGFFAKFRRRALPFVLAGGLAFGSNARSASQKSAVPSPSKPVASQSGELKPVVATITVPNISRTAAVPKKNELASGPPYPVSNLLAEGWTVDKQKKPQPKNVAAAKVIRPAVSPQSVELSKSISVRMPTNHISVEKINAELAKMNSPLAGKGAFVLRIAKAYNVDPAFFLAVARVESQGGTKGLATKTKNMCNIRWTQKSKYPNLKDFNVYPSWEQGVVGFFYQISRGSYYLRKGNHYVDGIIKKYAPNNENNTLAYIKEVENYMRRLGRS